MKNRRLLCAAVTAFFIFTGISGIAAEKAADAAAPARFEEKGLALGESSISYPVLKEGTVPEALREKINRQILEDGKITEYVTRISQLISGGSLRVQWRGQEIGDIFSFAVSAEGAVETPRNTFVWTAGNIDLRDGHEVTLKSLFTDPETAREKIETYLEETVAPEMSAYLLNSQMIPIPEIFRIQERGLILMYPIDQLSTLSDRAGDVLIPWQVIRNELDPGEGGVPAALHPGARIRPLAELSAEEKEEAAEQIRQMTAEGAIPGIPARLGDSLAPLTEAWKMLTDPDVYALGRFFSLEGAEFRNVFLMTDYLSEGWENSRVDGIRVDLGSVCGLSIGETEQAAWRECLGEPEHTIEMDAETAEAYRTVPGSRDYYVFGGHRLQLHADGNGILTSVILTE